MKKLLLVLLFTLNLGSYVAQITVTSVTFPAPNDTLWYALDDKPAPALVSVLTPPGGNQFWNLSQIKPGPSFTVRYLPAIQGIHTAKFPGSKMVIVNPTNESYYNVSGTRFDYMGLHGKDPFGLNLDATIRIQPVIPERRSPMNFFDINQTTGNYILSFPITALPESVRNTIPGINQVDSFRIRMSTQRLDVVDAYGMLRIPAGDYNVLREKRTEYQTTSLDVHTFLGWIDASSLNITSPPLSKLFLTDTTTRYHYFNDKEKEVIAVITVTNDQSGISSIQVKSKPQSISTDAKSSTIPRLNVRMFPNPASEWVIFDFINVPADRYIIKMYNLQGKEIWWQTFNMAGNKSFQLPLDLFESGTYFLRLSNENGSISDTQHLIVLKH